MATLWDEMHTRQPWRAANEGGSLEAFPDQASGNSTRLLMVIAINTVRRARGYRVLHWKQSRAQCDWSP